MLGGLIQDDMNEGVSKVPLLGDIPILGNLFKSRNKSRAKTNLLVFLRPTVLRDVESGDNVTKDKYSDIWEVEINSVGHENYDEMFGGKRPN